MKEPHNYKKVGYAMILVSASLAAIGLLGLAIGENVLFGDEINRSNQEIFRDCKAKDFQGDECKIFWDQLNNDVSGIYVDLEGK